MTNDILNRLIPILRHPRIDVKVAAEREKVGARASETFTWSTSSFTCLFLYHLL